MASIDDPAANSPQVWNRRSFTTNYTADCIRNPFNHPLELLGFGTFVAVVIETLEHKAISESSEVMTKLTANSCIAFAVRKTQSAIHRRNNQILPVAAMRVSNPDRSLPGING